MEFLQEYSEVEGSSASDVPSDVPSNVPSKIIILQAKPSGTTHPVDIDRNPIAVRSLFERIDSGELFTQPNINTPTINILFFPKVQWKNIGQKSRSANKIFEKLGLHKALFAYLRSSRSGWYYVAGDGQCSFMIKDYPYMLAWSFNSTTLETRAIIAARDEFDSYPSSLKSPDGAINLLGIHDAHFYHPLSLACLCLTDLVFRFDREFLKGYKISKIEKLTLDPKWKLDGDSVFAAAGELLEASETVSDTIFEFANLFKSIEVASTIIKSLEAEKLWKRYRAKNRDPDEVPVRSFNICTESFRSAMVLIKLRMRSIRQSGNVVNKRAEAQSTKVRFTEISLVPSVIYLSS